MLYAGLSAPGTPRQIGLAYWTPMGWRRCNGPFIPAGGRSYPRNAIDPEPLVLGHRLFVFFGGGRTASLGGGMHGVIVLRTYAL